MPLTPNEMIAAITRNLEKNTGKSVAGWITVVLKDGPPGTRERIAWLKSVHGLGTIASQHIVGEAEKPVNYREPTPDELLEAQYAGAKAGLRPIYDRLAAEMRQLGPDVMLDPRQTYVSVRRGTQFAIIQPTTRSRIDLALRLKGVEPTSRLQPAGNAGSGSSTHKVVLTAPGQVDAEVIAWLRQAYEQRA